MSVEKIVVQCDCGKQYKATSDKIGKKMRCKACGEPFTITPVEEAGAEEQPSVSEAAAPRPASTTAAPDLAGMDTTPADEDWTPHLEKFKRAKRMKLSTDIPEVNPDSLMSDISKPMIGRTMVISLILHVVFLGLTSTGFLIHYTTEASRTGVWSWSELQETLKKEEETRLEEERKAEAELKKQERLKRIQEEDLKKDLEKQKEAKTDKKELSEVEKSSTEVINERPGGSDVSFDLDVDSLEAK